MIIFEIPGKPIPWKRARIYGKRFYDEQSKQKSDIRNHLKNACKSHLMVTGGLKITIEYRMPMPKSWSNTKRLNTLGEPHISAPDLSNLIKFVEDTLNEVMWKDDRLIYEIHARKFYGEEGSTRFIIEEYQNRFLGSLIPNDK